MSGMPERDLKNVLRECLYNLHTLEWALPPAQGVEIGNMKNRIKEIYLEHLTEKEKEHEKYQMDLFNL